MVSLYMDFNYKYNIVVTKTSGQKCVCLSLYNTLIPCTHVVWKNNRRTLSLCRLRLHGNIYYFRSGCMHHACAQPCIRVAHGHACRTMACSAKATNSQVHAWWRNGHDVGGCKGDYIHILGSKCSCCDVASSKLKWPALINPVACSSKNKSRRLHAGRVRSSARRYYLWLQLASCVQIFHSCLSSSCDCEWRIGHPILMFAVEGQPASLSRGSYICVEEPQAM